MHIDLDFLGLVALAALDRRAVAQEIRLIDHCAVGVVVLLEHLVARLVAHRPAELIIVPDLHRQAAPVAHIGRAGIARQDPDRITVAVQVGFARQAAVHVVLRGARRKAVGGHVQPAVRCQERLADHVAVFVERALHGRRADLIFAGHAVGLVVVDAHEVAARVVGVFLDSVHAAVVANLALLVVRAALGQVA